MIGIVLFLGFVAFCQADSCCTMEDRREIVHLWQVLWSAENTGRRVIIGQEAFKRFLDKAPEAIPLFKNVNVADMTSPEFKAHVVRLTNGLDTCINLAYDPATLQLEVEHLQAQHSKYTGIKKDHFRILRNSFLEVLPQAVPCFNTAAWERCLTTIQDGISAGL